MSEGRQAIVAAAAVTTHKSSYACGETRAERTLNNSHVLSSMQVSRQVVLPCCRYLLLLVASVCVFRPVRISSCIAPSLVSYLCRIVGVCRWEEEV